MQRIPRFKRVDNLAVNENWMRASPKITGARYDMQPEIQVDLGLESVGNDGIVLSGDSFSVMFGFYAAACTIHTERVDSSFAGNDTVLVTVWITNSYSLLRLCFLSFDKDLLSR